MVASTGSLAAIFTNSARDPTFIFCITWPRCAFTVISLMPSSPATYLFNKPATTNAMTCRSRRVDRIVQRPHCLIGASGQQVANCLIRQYRTKPPERWEKA